MSVRIGRAMRQHRTIGGWLHALWHRDKWWRFRAAEYGCWICRATFAAINHDFPDFAEGIARGKADADAGRTYYHERDGRGAPSEKWSPDDPQQPDGWHHDGTAWVLNDDGGWFQDDSGFWRYNKPGDAGWTKLDDGSWHYTSGMAR